MPHSFRGWHSRRICGPGAGTEGAGGRFRRRRSLLFKLLLALLAAGIAVNAMVGGFWRFAFFRQVRAPVERNLAHYARSLAEEIGAPPDTAKARRLAARYALGIRYEGPEGVWESGRSGVSGNGGNGGDGDGDDKVREGGERAGSATEPIRRLREIPGEPGVRIGWGRHRFLVETSAGEGRFTFEAGFDPFEGGALALAALITLLSLVLAALFVAIRRLLSPLRDLTDGVERLRRGKLGHQVPVRGRDELAALARSFNAMSGDLRDMVHGREQLLLDVSHELRTPITRIKLALEMGPEGMAKESIAEDLREMEAMIAEILENARLDSENGKLRPEDFDLAALTEEAIADAAARSPGADIAPFRKEPRAGSTIRGDRARVRKVLSNVIDNAAKYSRPDAGPVVVGLDSGPEGVTVRVEDRGPGIPESELPKIFEPFYRVDRSRSRASGGYGLGLSLCKRIMEAHGGSISIASREGEGTVVSLTFPHPPRVPGQSPAPFDSADSADRIDSAAER